MKSLVIEKNDLIYNINKIKEIANKNANNEEYKIIAVIKGNGYGLGLVEYARVLIEHGITMLAVVTIEEALVLKEAELDADIMILSSTCIKEDVEKLAKNGIILTIGSNEAAKIANDIGKNIPIRAHVKIDTGFGRYGFLYNEIKDILNVYKDFPNIKIEGIFSHFAQSFAKSEKYTKLQFDRYMSVIETLEMNCINPGIMHVCNSSAFLKYPNMYLNAARIGSAFLGRLQMQNDIGLKRIAKLETSVTEIKTLPKGYNIGYSCTAKTKKQTKIAIAQVGYSDGFNVSSKNDMFRFVDKLRFLKNAIERFIKKEEISVMIDGFRCKILGQVGMHHIVIDITDKDVKIGSLVQLDVNPIYVQSNIRREYR